MNHDQMNERCSNSKFIKRVILKDYRFVYDGFSDKRAGSVANIIPSRKRTVHGGLFEIKEVDLASLNGHETNYKQAKLDVVDEEGNSFNAVVIWPRKVKKLLSGFLLCNLQL